MTPRLVIGVAVFALVVAACTSGETQLEPSTTTTEAVSTATTVPPVERLVVATASGDVAIYDQDLAEVITIASGEAADFRQPVWLDASSVLYAEATAQAESALIVADAMTGDERWRASMPTLPFYYLPAPAAAGAATTSLRSDPAGGLVAELVGSDGSVQPLDTVSPYYTSWSPDGSALAVHAESERVTVRRDGAEDVIAEPSGVFQAPVWTDSGLVTLRTAAGVQRLSVWSEDNGFRDLATIDGPVRFIAGGGKIAIQSADVGDGGGVQAGVQAQTIPDLPGGRLAVVDVETGAIETVSDVLAAIYQWDPAGSRLLFATFDDGATLNLTWRVWSQDGVISLSSFLAQASWFRDVVPFFDQYDQSVSMWSASGEQIAYPAVVDERLVVIVEKADGSGTQTIDGATWSSWLRSR